MPEIVDTDANFNASAAVPRDTSGDVDPEADPEVDREGSPELGPKVGPEHFDQLYQQTRDEVAFALFHMLGRRRGLEPLVVEIYRRAFGALSRSEAERPFRSILFGACAAVALGQLRWWRRRSPRPASENSETAPAAPAPVEEQSAAMLHSALDELSARVRLVYVFHELLGMSAEEISQSIGLAERGVAARLGRARMAVSAFAGAGKWEERA